LDSTTKNLNATGTILLVEDEENDAFFMQWAVTSAGVENPLQVTNDGREAIDYLKGAGRFADRKEFPLPSLVLLDLKLPYVMGLDVLEWIRQQPQLAPIVIIFSSSAAEADITAACRLGANGYLVKPSEARKLVDMAKGIKDLWLTPDAPPPNFLVDRGRDALPNPHDQDRAGHQCQPVSGPSRLPPYTIHGRIYEEDQSVAG
jgi:CheY-like chemotaxis protein